MIKHTHVTIENHILLLLLLINQLLYIISKWRREKLKLIIPIINKYVQQIIFNQFYINYL